MSEDDRFGLLPPGLQAASKELDTWSQAQLLADQEASTPQVPLYHYTDESGIKGILATERIWCFSHLHQTDRAEFTYSLDIAREVIQEVSRSDDRVTHYFALCLEDLLSNNSFTDTFEFYLFSLSRHRDDPRQWEEFGRNGTGYSIGFSATLFAPTELQLKEFANENLFVGKVIYGDDAIRKRHMRVISKAAEITSHFANRNEKLVRQVKPSTFLSAMAKEVIASQLIWNCLTGKKKRYENEQEVRFLIMNLIERFDGLRKTHSGKSYVEAPLPLRSAESVAEIIVGAQAPSDAEDRIAAYLRIQGYPTIPISRSSCCA
jgi:hypothetical protein